MMTRLHHLMNGNLMPESPPQGPRDSPWAAGQRVCGPVFWLSCPVSSASFLFSASLKGSLVILKSLTPPSLRALHWLQVPLQLLDTMPRLGQTGGHCESPVLEPALVELTSHHAVAHLMDLSTLQPVNSVKEGLNLITSPEQSIRVRSLSGCFYKYKC